MQKKVFRCPVGRVDQFRHVRHKIKEKVSAKMYWLKLVALTAICWSLAVGN